MKREGLFARGRPTRSLLKRVAIAGTLLAAIVLAVRLLGRGSISEQELHGLLKSGPLTVARVVGLPWNGEAFTPTSSEKEVLRRLTKRAISAAVDGTAEERRLAALLMAASGDLAGAAQLLSREAGAAGDPASRSDHSAYLLELGVRTQRPELLLESLEATIELQQERPAWREVAFNRAASLEGLGLRRVALGAWLEAELAEADPGWKAEERRRREALLGDSPGAAVRELGSRMQGSLDATLIARVAELLPGEAAEIRRIGFENLLQGWARAVLAKDVAAASEELADLSRLGELLRAGASDDCLAKTAASVAKLESLAGEAQRLANDTNLLMEAMSLQSSGRRQAALTRLAELRADAWADLPCLALWAKSREVSCRALAGDARNALRVGREALEVVDPGVSLGVSSELRVSLAVAASVEGSSVEALHQLSGALNEVSSLKDRGLAAWIRALRGGIFAEMGRTSEAGADLALAARDARYLVRPGREFLLIDSLNHYVVDPAWPRASAWVQRELVAIAEERGDPASLSHAHLVAGESRWKQPEERLAELAAAESAAGLVEDAFERRRRLLLVDLAAAEASAAQDPEASARSAKRAIELVDTTGMEAYRPQSLLALGRALRSSGELKSAERVLKEAREWALKLRKSGRSADERALLAAASRDVQDEIVALHLEDLHDPWGALREAESARLPWMAGAPSAQWLRAAPQAIQGRLRAGSAAIVYFQRDPGVDVWWFTSRDSGYSWVPRSRAELEQSLASEAGAVNGSSSKADLRPERLAEELLAPLSSQSETISHLVIVPDEELIALPYSEVRLRGGTATWGEVSEIVFSPSLGSFAEASLAARATPTQGVAILANGAPQADGPQALASAEQEARSIAALYPGSHLLLGASATLGELRRLGGIDLLHVAAHGRVSDSPEETALLLAPDRELTDGAWTVGSIARLGERAPRLVVLSSCLSAYGARTGGRGSLSLASAFLAAGSETVIASIRPVDDRATAEFMTALHRELASGSSPAAALRRARGEFGKLATPGSPNPASSFVVIRAR